MYRITGFCLLYSSFCISQLVHELELLLLIVAIKYSGTSLIWTSEIRTPPYSGHLLWSQMLYLHINYMCAVYKITVGHRTFSEQLAETTEQLAKCLNRMTENNFIYIYMYSVGLCTYIVHFCRLDTNYAENQQAASSLFSRYSRQAASAQSTSVTKCFLCTLRVR